ncbi:Uncharacterized protein FKW44_024557, partial [Caligus rogercresseyi]
IQKKKKISPHQKDVEFALFNMKSLIAKRLTNNSDIRIEDLRAIMIEAAARYSGLSIKIPNSSATSWTWAWDLIKFIPSNSLEYLKLIKSTIRRHQRFILNKK